MVTLSMSDGSKCVLPAADRAQRTIDFRALFSTGLIERSRTSDGVEWRLAASAASEAESRRLAQLEERCCDGITFAVHTTENQVVWRISGPPSAAPTLDTFYQLPILVGTEEGARELWSRLDAAACGPQPPAPHD